MTCPLFDRRRAVLENLSQTQGQGGNVLQLLKSASLKVPCSSSWILGKGRWVFRNKRGTVLSMLGEGGYVCGRCA